MRSEACPEMASVLQRFVAGVENALGSNFLGAYLVGSLATGDFDLDSDVDFLILVPRRLGIANGTIIRGWHPENMVPASLSAQPIRIRTAHWRKTSPVRIFSKY